MAGNVSQTPNRLLALYWLDRLADSALYFVSSPGTTHRPQWTAYYEG